MRYSLSVIVVSLLACRTDSKTVTVDTQEVETTLYDSDGDGYLSDEDCDDFAADIHPQAEEICDSLDNDCDGEIDEDVDIAYYADTDDDGFGDTDVVTYACSAPNGYVPNANDCDDSNDTVYPSATEICDGLDNNCDTDIDEGLGGFWYLDADYDGFGDDASMVQGCVAQDGYVSIGGDCNDADFEMNPDAEEVCDDIDNNCDGEVDEGVLRSFYLDADGDGYGDSNVVVEACEQGANMSTYSGDCDDINQDVSPVAIETCVDNIDNNCDGQVNEGTAIDAVIWYRDLDGDTFGNLHDTIYACTQPIGYVSDSTDCLDVSPTQHPGATEYCDNLDNDCNGVVDDLGSIGSTVYYADADGDGFGNPNQTISSCLQPAGTVSNGWDCDDTDNTVYLGAVELCDGQVNACGNVLSTNEIDDDGDGYVECTINSNGWDGVASVIGGGDCIDTDFYTHPSANQLCDGVDNTCLNALPITEIDNDGDGRVECTIDTIGWQGLASVVAGDDCDDSENTIYTNAPELCDGQVNACGNVLSVNEIDDDGDGYVECTIDANGWDGVASVIGGGDCVDTDADTYVGAGYLESNPNLCMTDADGDGYGTETPIVGVVAGTDCLDSDAVISPATLLCGEGLNCADIYQAGGAQGSGTYLVDPDGVGVGLDPFEVYCDMNPADPGWTEIPYSADLPYGQHFSGGDAPLGSGFWLPTDFSMELSNAQITALRSVAVEGRQTYVGLCNHVITYYYTAGGGYDYAFGFEMADGSVIGGGMNLSNHPYVSVLQDGCKGNGGEGGALGLATIFSFNTTAVPVRNVRCRDCGDGGEYFGSPLMSNSAWLR